MKAKLAPTFKCQDITTTGTLLTCAVRMGFKAMAIERRLLITRL